MEEIKAVDAMCRAGYFLSKENIKKMFEIYEFQVMARTTFGGLLKKMKLKPEDEWQVLASMAKGSLEEGLKEMDEAGIEYVMIDQALGWSQHDYKEWGTTPIETMYELNQKSKGRLKCGAGYNPFRIEESVQNLERAVKDFGFKYVWAHPISFGLRPDDRRMYPLYAKCNELKIACAMQVGHSAEPLTSECGHPMYADVVALDYPNLTLILTHTGWPWIDEWMSMVWKHQNVYGNIGAYMPSALDESLVKFFDGPRGQDKVMWATNGFGMSRCKSEFLALPIKDATKVKVLRENALKVFKI